MSKFLWCVWTCLREWPFDFYGGWGGKMSSGLEMFFTHYSILSFYLPFLQSILHCVNSVYLAPGNFFQQNWLLDFFFQKIFPTLHKKSDGLFSPYRLTSVDDFEFISHSDLQPRAELVLQPDRSVPVDIENQVKIENHNDPLGKRYLDKQCRPRSDCSGAVWSGFTVFTILSTSFWHYPKIVNVNCWNLRIITAVY